MRTNVFAKIIPGLAIMLIFSACGQNSAAVKENAEIPLREVKVQTIASAEVLKKTLTYPATLIAGENFKILAKTNGNATEVNFQPGDRVHAGQILMRIDDNSGSQKNTNQVEQARLAMEQTRQSLELAQKNYQNLLATTQKDLESSALNTTYAQQTQNNTAESVAANRKNATLAVENANINLEQAQNNLDDKRILLDQNLTDAQLNAEITMSGINDGLGAILRGLDTAFDFDTQNDIVLNYKSSLGVLDTATLTLAEDRYKRNKNDFNMYLKNTPTDTDSHLQALLTLTTDFQKTLETAWDVLEKSVTSTDLPLNSVSGTSLSSLRSLVSGYQSQINGYSAQLRGSEQTLSNLRLNRDSTLSSLQKAVTIAEKQVQIAMENLRNLNASLDTQQDQTDLAAELRQNEFENLKLKLDLQLESARTQKEQAELQYQNATLSWNTLADSALIKAPVDGIVSQKTVEAGSAVAAGQTLVVISPEGQIKAQFYLDKKYQPYVSLGQAVLLKDGHAIVAESQVTVIAPQAENLSKRFLVEVAVTQKNEDLLLGTLLTAELEVSLTSQKNGFFLPLSAVNIGQNSKNILLIKNDQALSVPVTLGETEGDFVEVFAEVASTDQVVISGNKLVTDQEKVKIIK